MAARESRGKSSLIWRKRPAEEGPAGQGLPVAAAGHSSRQEEGMGK